MPSINREIFLRGCKNESFTTNENSQKQTSTSLTDISSLHGSLICISISGCKALSIIKLWKVFSCMQCKFDICNLKIPVILYKIALRTYKESVLSIKYFIVENEIKESISRN